METLQHIQQQKAFWGLIESYAYTSILIAAFCIFSLWVTGVYSQTKKRQYEHKEQQIKNLDMHNKLNHDFKITSEVTRVVELFLQHNYDHEEVWRLHKQELDSMSPETKERLKPNYAGH